VRRPIASHVPSPTTAPFAAGREADVYALDDGRVLRRYRTGADATGEAQVMAYVGRFGYPVPEVFAVDGTDLVMARVDGVTMSEALVAGQLTAGEGASMLADLLRRLHELPPWDDAPAGACVVHLDLHPDNVLLTVDGPVVIDWHNARAADADLDTALTALILAEVAIGSIPHPLAGEAGVALDAFLAVAPGDPLRMLDDVVTFRSGQLNTLTADEIGALGVAAARVRGDR
jgi:aminoglycoside phosphotransferase (APT) family kinase protein